MKTEVLPGFACAQFLLCWPSFIVRLTTCGGSGRENRRLPAGSVPNLMLLKL
jgi:hypothetical protein